MYTILYSYNDICDIYIYILIYYLHNLKENKNGILSNNTFNLFIFIF